MKLHAITKSRGYQTDGKRRGRGNGSGKGTFSGRGCKGQKSRTGWSRKPWFEGGQTPLIQKLPKLRGFKNPNRVPYVGVNVGSLERINGTDVTLEALVEAGLIASTKVRVKLLANGEVKEGYTVHVHAASKSATEKIEAKGGKVQILQ